MTSTTTASAEVLACQQPVMLLFLIVFLPPTHTPLTAHSSPAGSCSTLRFGKMVTFCLLRGDKQLSVLFLPAPKRCTVMLLLNRHRAQGCSCSFVHLMYTRAITRGELHPHTPPLWALRSMVKRSHELPQSWLRAAGLG